jgi:hypothetical protein
VLELDQVRRYGWADEDPDLAWTLAVVTGRAIDDVIRAYAGDPDQEPTSLRFAQAQVPPDELGAYSLIQVRQEAARVVLIENNGWLGKRAEVAQRASGSDGTFLSVFWSLNANYKVVQAENGRLTASFDPLSVRHPAPAGETYPDWITEVVFTHESLNAVLLAVVEQQTGLVFDPVWLAEPMPTYRIPTP